MKQPVVFLDRDGVINRALVRNGKPYPPASVHEVELTEGVHEALDSLRRGGFRLIVVTNQPDIARGTQSQSAVDAIHEHLLTALPLDEIRVCPHDDADGCDCRKPLPGMLLRHGEHTDFSRSFMVGDRWRDVEAGRRAGCRTVFLDYGYDESGPCDPDTTLSTITEAALWILNQADTNR